MFPPYYKFDVSGGSALVDVAVVALVGAEPLHVRLRRVRVEVAEFGRDVAQRAVDVLAIGSAVPQT